MALEACQGRRILEINILSEISELIIASLLKVMREAICTKSFLRLLSPITKSSCNYWISTILSSYSVQGMRRILLKPNS